VLRIGEPLFDHTFEHELGRKRMSPVYLLRLVFQVLVFGLEKFAMQVSVDKGDLVVHRFIAT